MLLKPVPASSMNDAADCRAGYSIFAGERRLLSSFSSTGLANIADNGLRQFCSIVQGSFTATGAPATFGDAVGHVVSVRSREKVSWVDTGWIIAAVKHTKSRRNRPYEKREGNSMGEKHAASDAELSIAVGSTCCPGPAIICMSDVNSRPKTSRVKTREFRNLARRNRHNVSPSWLAVLPAGTSRPAQRKESPAERTHQNDFGKELTPMSEGSIPDRALFVK